MSKAVAKTEVKPFDPRTQLRMNTEYFMHDDKVVGERTSMQYYNTLWENWYNLKTNEEYTKLYDLTSLEHKTGVTMRPGVAEQIEELKNEEDDD